MSSCRSNVGSHARSYLRCFCGKPATRSTIPKLLWIKKQTYTRTSKKHLLHHLHEDLHGDLHEDIHEDLHEGHLHGDLHEHLHEAVSMCRPSRGLRQE